jgi:hypothetical protein
MAKKTNSRNMKTAQPASSPAGCNLLLALTLVPVIIGVLLIGAWGLDITIFDEAQAQITVGILFILLGFTASNALQRRRGLAAGWGLLAVADVVMLAWLDVRAQLVAAGFGLVGLVFLAVEFFRQYRRGRAEKAKK